VLKLCWFKKIKIIKQKFIYLFWFFSTISRRQLHYHSQRRDSKESVVRPSSNYYEYESVMRSLPYTSGTDQLNAPRQLDNNSNSLTRQCELSSSYNNQGLCIKSISHFTCSLMLIRWRCYPNNSHSVQQQQCSS